MMQKTQDNKAWLLVLPVFLMVAFSAIIPLMTVVNYSVQDILDPRPAASWSAPTGSGKCCRTRGAAWRAAAPVHLSA